MKRKLLAALCVAAMTSAMLAGCGSETTTEETQTEETANETDTLLMRPRRTLHRRKVPDRLR